MADITDDELEDMTELLKQAFGTAEEETVTENMYSFKGKNETMKDDIVFLQSMRREGNGRLYVKSKYGFDK